MTEWAVFAEPSTWTFLLGGLWVTLRISAATILFSFVLGTLLALASMARAGPLRWLAATYVQVMRGIPVFVVILVSYFGLGRLGVHVDAATSVALALIVYTTAYISEIVRGGLLSVARGQMDAAQSLGIRRVDALRFVILPQAFRAMVPPLVNQYIIAINGTSIGSVIGLDELLRRSVILYNGHQNPIQTLVVSGTMYFLVLFALSSFSRRFELSHLMQRPTPTARTWPVALLRFRRYAEMLTTR